MGEQCGERKESRKREISTEEEEGRGGGGGGCCGLTVLPVSINPIKVLKIRSYGKLLTWIFRYGIGLGLGVGGGENGSEHASQVQCADGKASWSSLGLPCP